MQNDAQFVEAWLYTDTFIPGLNPAQVKAVRNLCSTFFSKGRKVRTRKEHDKRDQDQKS